MLPHNSAPDATDARTVTRTVVFRNSFTLTALETRQPAGSYLIESDEERLAAVSFPAYRRVVTWLRIPAVPGRGEIDRLVNVDPSELDAALAADGAAASSRLVTAEQPGGPDPDKRRGWRRPALPFTFGDWLVRNGTEMRWIVYAVVAMAVLGTLMNIDLPRGGGLTLHPEFAALPAEFNDFLFLLVGEEASGSDVTVYSALTRVGIDPWAETARLSAMPGTPRR